MCLRLPEIFWRGMDLVCIWVIHILMKGCQVDMGIKRKWLWMMTAVAVLAATLALLGTASAHGGKIVYVYSDSCGYCKSFGPVFEKVIQDYPQVRVERLDIHKKPELEEALRLGAVATPTLFMVEDGQVQDKLEGEVPEKVLRGFLQKHAAALAS